MTRLLDDTAMKAKAAEAVALFPNAGMHYGAEVLAYSHPWAIDYIRQAPVIVLAAFHGAASWRSLRSSESLFISSAMHRLCENRTPLKKVLAAYGLAFQMRQIAPYAVAPSHWGAIRLASTCRPSALAQAVPDRPRAQANWLRAIEAWGSHWLRRARRPYEPKFVEWIVSKIGSEKSVATDIADFMIFAPERFEVRWSLDEAKSALERWHAEQAYLSSAREFARRFGVEFNEPVEYPGFPESVQIDGFDFIALRSGMDLYLEGKAMKHCVFSYAGSAVIGHCRLFSIRHEGRRVATLEMATDPKEWGVYRPAQLRGPCNATRLPKAVNVAVEKFAQQFRVDPLAPEPAL